MPKPKPTIPRCQSCSAAAKTLRLPPGWKWKLKGKEAYCEACWHARYVLQAHSVPVAGPVGTDWKSLNTLLGRCWRESTSLANWAMTELVKADVVPTPDMERLPKAEKIDLYKRFNGIDGRGPGYPGRAAWDGATQSANAVLRKAQRLYLQRRRDILWTRNVSLPTFRYPTPFAVDADAWKVVPHEGGAALIEVALPGGRVTLRLKGGPEFGRQRAAFNMLADGRALPVEIAVYRQGFREKHMMVKLVGWFPRKDKGERARTMLVRTDSNAFWVAELEGRPAWIEPALHVKRWVEGHLCYLRQIGQATKYEKRWTEPERRKINVSRARRCEKHNDRIDSWNHQATAMLANFARRNGVAEVLYDDSIKSYLEKYPWHDLRAKLAYKLDAAGITLTAAPEVGADNHDHEQGAA